MNISVILPIYNVEDYLSKAVESVLNQSLTSIEIILVDDGATDSSGAIADRLGKRDGRIKVFHKENGGAPSARNLGISVSSGKYLYFMDPDDWMKSTFLEELYDKAERDDAQLTIAGFTNQYFEGGHEFQTKVVPDSQTYGNQKAFRDNAYKYFNNTLIAVPWNKLYLASYIKTKNISFPDVKWDDLHFNMKVIKNISRVSVISNTDYQFFRSRPGSETTTVFDKNLVNVRKAQFEHVLDVYEYWGDVSSESIGSIYYYYATRLVQCVQEIMGDSNLRMSEKRHSVKKIVDDNLSRRAFQLAVCDSWPIRVCLFPMKLRFIGMTMLMGKSISFFKKRMVNVFYRMKLRVMQSE